MDRLLLFGAPAASVGGRSVALPVERRSQLVVHLALRGDWVGRAELAALLWPDAVSKLALANLRKTLFRLPGQPWAPPLEMEGNALRLRVATDVADFDAAVRDARHRDAAAMAGAALLQGFDDDGNEAWSTWLRFERDRLRDQWRASALACLAEAPGSAEAIALATRLLEADPLDEAALHALLDGLARTGQGSRALTVYREHADRLQAELGIAPGAELQALVRQLQSPGAGAGTAAGPAAAPAPPDADFVGRAAELRRVEALLFDEGCRLLCLLGPGGVGKTRLGREVLRRLGPRHAQGGLFVPVEDVADADELAGRLARELGVAPGAGGAAAAVVEHLRLQQKLLVVDNYEQLAGEVALLEALVRDCPGVRLVVTSRVRPATATAWALPLDGLPCPEPEDADHLDGFDAARLFLLAARRVGADVSAHADAAAVIEICRRLGGHPLALELAAAWTRVLGCAEIAAELAEDLGLLQSADGARPARHAGIAEVFERSWQLLSPAERDALARLSVFRGGFTAESARAAAGVALALVGALVDKSLVAREGRRLHLHPLVQQFAADKLVAADVGLAVPNGHAAYFLDWLQSLDMPVRRGDRDALQAVDAEFDNCRQAWRFAARHGPAAALMRAALPLVVYAHHRGRFDDVLALVQGALAQPLATHDPRLQGLLASQEASLLLRLARYAEGEAAARLALARAREGRLQLTRYEACAALGGCALGTGRIERAGRYFRQAYRLARGTGRSYDAPAMLENIALIEKRLGRYETALTLTQEALAEHRRNGDRAKEAQSLSNLASMCMFMDEDEQARGYLQEALVIAERGGLVMTRAYVLANLTELAMRAADVSAARQHAERGLEVALAAGQRPLAGWLQVQLARASLREGDLALARGHLAAGCEAGLALQAAFVKSAALLGLAELLEAQGHAGGARRVLALGIESPGLSEADRDELRAEWARRADTGAADGAPAGWQLDALLGRVVAERDLAFGPLAAALVAT
jgi:predicted ATPase/DNA-binding SARP family transcriptional activator